MKKAKADTSGFEPFDGTSNKEKNKERYYVYCKCNDHYVLWSALEKRPELDNSEVLDLIIDVSEPTDMSECITQLKKNKFSLEACETCPYEWEKIGMSSTIRCYNLTRKLIHEAKDYEAENALEVAEVSRIVTELKKVASRQAEDIKNNIVLVELPKEVSSGRIEPIKVDSKKVWKDDE